MEPKIKSRLKEYCKYKGISVRKFESLSGFSNGQFTSLQTLTDETVSKISIAFPDLSISWLAYNEGDMIKDNSIGKADAEYTHIYDDELNMVADGGTQYSIEDKSKSFYIREMERYRGLFEDQVRINAVLIDLMSQLNKNSRKQSGGSAPEKIAGAV